MLCRLNHLSIAQYRQDLSPQGNEWIHFRMHGRLPITSPLVLSPMFLSLGRAGTSGSVWDWPMRDQTGPLSSAGNLRTILLNICYSLIKRKVNIFAISMGISSKQNPVKKFLCHEVAYEIKSAIVKNISAAHIIRHLINDSLLQS